MASWWSWPRSWCAAAMVLYRRQGQRDVAVTVEVEAEGFPDLCTLAPNLAELLGVQQASRAAVLHALWRYIQANKLQARTLLLPENLALALEIPSFHQIEKIIPCG